MRWVRSHRADPDVVPLADRHYNRQKIGSPQFAPPGRCLVLKTENLDAFWVTSWPFAEYVRHAWAGAWICSAFRNESAHLSSDLIREAVAATVAEYGPAPALGMITFVDTKKIRKKRDPGRCYLRAGFKYCGMTKGGLIALQLLPQGMPQALRPLSGNQGQGDLFALDAGAGAARASPPPAPQWWSANTVIPQGRYVCAHPRQHHGGNVCVESDDFTFHERLYGPIPTDPEEASGAKA